MKAYISYFPSKTVVSLPSGRVFSSHDQDELLLEMGRAGVVGADYEWIEHSWDAKLFPVLATWKRCADGMFVSTLPNGSTFHSKDEDELMLTIVQAGVTGLVPDFMDTWEPIAHRTEAGALLFNDRGNKLTFDRDIVSDDEIRLTLANAQQRYGCPLHLTGDDQIFTARMVRLADEMGIEIAR
jgi:hypothetical protein